MKLSDFFLSYFLFFLGTGLLSAKETFFNGKDLSGWSAEDMSYWSVQNGAIVGTKEEQKIQGNQFLWYDKKVKNLHSISMIMAVGHVRVVLLCLTGRSLPMNSAKG